MFYQLHHIVSPEYLKKEYGENFSYPPHMHQCFELAIVLDGEMTFNINNESYNLTVGEAVFIFPNQLHSLSSVKSRHMLFIFSPKIVQSFTVKYSGSIPLSPKFRPSEHLITALDGLSENESIISVKGLLYSAAAAFESTTRFQSSYSDKEDLLMRIFEFVDKNYRTECSLMEAARKLGYDNAYISRYFKRLTGMSYNNYVNVCRLNHASYLLKNSDFSILECAVESGYKSLRSFNRNFKEYFSVTPLEYKNR